MRIARALRRMFGQHPAAPAIGPETLWTKSYERRRRAASPYGDARRRVYGETSAAQTIAPRDRT